MADEETKPIKINVKTQKITKVVEAAADLQISEFKILVAEAFETNPQHLVLIFAGKIMKDTETLRTHKICDGLAVHLVIKAELPTSNSSESGLNLERTMSATSSSSLSTSSMPDLRSTPSARLGTGNMQEALNIEPQHNDDNIESELRAMVDCPQMQSILSDPDVIRELITSNPQVREAMNSNPELSHALNNRETMREVAQIVRNPAMFQEVLRLHDRALSNLESLPGGYDAMQRMYHGIQEPILNAATNPFAGLLNQTTNNSATNFVTNPQQGTENRAPLPNPWNANNTNNNENAPRRGTGGGTGNTGCMLNSPAMVNLLQQVSNNTELLQSILNSTHSRALFDRITQNPDVTSGIINDHCILARDPLMRQRICERLPSLLEHLHQPEMVNWLRNPETLAAVLQTLELLHQHYANTAPTMGTAATNASNSVSNTDNSTNTQVSGELVNNIISNLPLNANTDVNDNLEPSAPELRYASELEQLYKMGFTDRAANLRALIETSGNINDAIEFLLP